MKIEISKIVQQLGAGQFEIAMAACDAILCQDKNCSDAMHLRGVAALQLGNPQDAEKYIRQALRINPLCAEYYQNLGVALKALGQIESRIACYHSAIKLNPKLTCAYINLASAYLDDRNFRAALEAVLSALGQEPDNPNAWINLGNVHFMASRYDGEVLPLQSFPCVIQKSPVDSEVNSSTNTSAMILAKAEHCYRQTLKFKPSCAEALDNLAVVLEEEGRLKEAQENSLLALQCSPGFFKARASLLSIKMQRCDWIDLEENIAHLRHLFRRNETQEVLPFNFLTLPGVSALEQRRCAEAHSCSRLKLLAFSGEEYSKVVSISSRRLNVGYISADFRDHPVGKLVAPIIEHHDRSRFAVYGYGYGPGDVGSVGRRIRRAFDYFNDIDSLSFQQAAEKIKSDGIDILIDLTGYTRYNRAEILMLRPAPVQVSWLGYPGTMGLPMIDYLVGDANLIPPQGVPNFSEKLLLLPVYQTSDMARSLGSIPSRAECGLPEQGFVFCCWNNSYKITPQIFSIWMRLLAARPDSILWLYATNDCSVDNLRKTAAANAISPDRLIFMRRQPEPAYLAMATVADLYLDTFPYNAGATASDMLFAGLPILTCAGETYVSRMAGSLLMHLDIPEMVADNLLDYEAKALYFSQNSIALSAIRQRLYKAKASSLLFNNNKFTRCLELGLEKVWENHLSGSCTSPVQVSVCSVMEAAAGAGPLHSDSITVFGITPHK